MQIDEKYVVKAVEIANGYYGHKVETTGAAGRALMAAETETQTDANIAFIKSQPFDSAGAKATIRNVLSSLFRDVDYPREPKAHTRDIIYLSGAKPAKALLMQAAKDGTLPDLQRVVSDKNVVSGDFGRLKKLYSDLRVVHTSDGEKAIPENAPYGMYRPLMAGIDEAAQAYCADKRISQIIDNSCAPVNAEVANSGIATFEAQKKAGKLRMFAVALTPEEAVAECKKYNKGRPANDQISELEAADSARNFAAFYPALQEEFPDITLVDRNMKVIYEQKNSEPTANISGSAMKSWYKACGTTVLGIAPPDASAPGATQQKRSL